MNKCLNCKKETKNKKFCSISCQNKFQNTEKSNKKYGNFKKFKVICYKCGKEFFVEEREKMFPKKEKYYCGRSCANSRNHSNETKLKIKKKLTKNYKTSKITLICKQCNKNFEVNYYRRHQLFCSISCATTWKNINLEIGRKGGLASAKKQSKKRRSKNEIYFFELCRENFSNVSHNKSIFNGWDADVIIEDFKLAILWNGKWHYEKITKKHSVKQVQNRDKIKINEIVKCGYNPYVVKDLGKYNKEFVEGEFKKLFVFLKQNS